MKFHQASPTLADGALSPQTKSFEEDPSFEPIQLEFPGIKPRPLDALEWESPTKVLTEYLRAVGLIAPSLVARALLDEFGTLSDFMAASRRRLHRAVGKRLANIIHASRSLMKATLIEQVREGPVVCRSPELLQMLQLEVGFLRFERLLALYVDGNSRLMRIVRIGDGSLAEIAINNRRVIGCGLAVGASGFILVHNHPSGVPTPSQADLAATSRLRELGREVDLHLLDHLIIARGRFGSIEDFWREQCWTRT